jgi:hypothetical protein
VIIDGGLDWQLDLLNPYGSVTTSNYNMFTNSRTLQFARSHTCSQPAVYSLVFWQRLPTADVPLPLCSRTVSVPQLQELSTDCVTDSKLVMHIPSRHGPHRKQCSSVLDGPMLSGGRCLVVCFVVVA